MLLPFVIKNKFEINWCPIFCYLEDKLPLPRNTTMMTEEKFDVYFCDCVEVLKNRVSYVFSKKGEKGTLAFSVATWSRLVLKSSIIKNGNEHDKSFIDSPAQIFRRAVGAVRKRTASVAPKHLRRQEVRIARVSNRNASDVEERMGPENHDDEASLVGPEIHDDEASLVPAANAAEAPNSFLSEFN